MSKVQSIVPNYQNKLSFTGKAAEASKALTRAQEILVDQALTKHYLGWSGRSLDFLSKTAGELQTVGIIGVGTAFIAPIFIAYNPFSKQDENDKKYSALRQPISAVIATGIGLGINYPIAVYLDKRACEGRPKKFDISAMPSANYLKGKYKKIIRNFKNLKGQEKKYFDMISGGKISTVEEFKKAFMSVEEFKKAVHSKTLKAAAQKLLDPNNSDSLHNLTVRDFLIKNMGFKVDSIDNTILNPDVTEAKLNKTTAMSFLRTFGFSEDEVDEKSLRTFINNNMCKKKVWFNAHERKYVTKATELMVTEELKNKEKISMNNLFEILGIEGNFYKNHKILDQKMDEFLLSLDKKMNIKAAVEATQPRKIFWPARKVPKERLEKFAKQIAKNAVKDAESAFKAHSKILGIVLSLAVLPFSCGLLNWSYPKIMKKYFPQLLEEKSDKKGGK